MFGKVLHNVYQVRVGQQLYPTTIGRKYIFPPADISMQYFEQRKAIVNTCQLCDDRFDRELACYDGSALKLMSENEESEASTHTSLDTIDKPKSSPPVLSRPLSAKLSNLAARGQASRKSKSTNWYLHHVPPSIQRNIKCPNEKTRNISMLNDFANRNYLNRDFKPIKQRSQICAALSQVRKPNVNSVRRPNTVPNAREGKFAKYSKPNIGPLNAKPFTNFSFHTQCNSMSVRQCKDENATFKNYAEYFRKRKLGSKYKLFPDEFSTNTSVRNFKDLSSHKLKEPDLNENSSKLGKSDTPFSTTKQCDSSRPSTPLRHQNCRVIHFNTHALKQDSKIQHDRSGEKINKEESLDEPAAKIQRNIDVSATASKASKMTNGKSSNKLSAAHPHNKPKKLGNDDSRPSSKQKFSITATERPVSRAKSVVQTKASSCQTRRPQTPVEKKQAFSGIPLYSGRQRNTLYELQNKVRKEKRESKKQKYFPPLGASHSFGRPITTRPATSPGRFRDAPKKGTDQSKVKRKLDESYARTLMEELKIKRPKTAGGRESEKYASAYSKVDRFRHPRPRLIKPKFEESVERGRDTFHHDDRKYHSDEAEIQRLKRQMFVNSISNGMKPKSSPKLKAKNSGTNEGLNERKEMANATEREIPILHADNSTESRTEASNSVVGNVYNDTSMEATDTKDSKEKCTVRQIVQVQTIQSAMEVDTRKRSMTSNITQNKETGIDIDEEIESTKPKKPLNSSEAELLTNPNLHTQPLSYIKLDKSTSLDQRIAETFEAMRLAQEEACKTEPLTDPLERGRQTSKTKYKNLYSLPNENENADRKLTPGQISQADVQDAKEPETEVKSHYKKYFIDSRLSDWLKDVRNSEVRDRRRHSFIRERNKPLDFTKNIESFKSLDKRREENSNRVKVTDDNTQQISYKRKRKEPFDHRQISRFQKSKIGRFSEEIGTVKTEERSKLTDSVLQKRSCKYISPERRKSKIRKRPDHNGSSQTSQDSFDKKSHSQQNMKCATDFLDVIEKRKVKSSVVIGDKKLRDKKKTSLSFHNLGRKPLDRNAKKYPVTKSIRSRSEIDLKGKSVFEQWRARLRRLKNSFFGGKD